MKGRKQRVKIGSYFSSWIEILLGVPQGSVLGPIIFNIFINDLILFISDSLVCNFADDTTLYAHGTCIETVIHKLECDINTSIEWFTNNSLIPNPDKFQVMFLGTKKLYKLCLEIGNNKTISSSTVSLLGITIDWKLQFNDHVKFICEKANRKACAMMRLRNILSVDQKLILFNSFLVSQFGYCPLIWMHHGKHTNRVLNSIHKRALRSVYNDFTSNFDELLAKGNHCRIHDLNLKRLIVKVYKCIHGESPNILSDIFVTRPSNFNLRINNVLVLPKCSTQTSLHSFEYRGSSVWNLLPDEYKDSKTSSLLKSCLDGYIIKCSCKLCTV